MDETRKKERKKERKKWVSSGRSVGRYRFRDLPMTIGFPARLIVALIH